ncbi:GH18 domain-containing protein [Caenorhabditis elegans]|uniref:GH18 domain-containing protein n=1 Tax=Caenorhabditis elegans TaxID=6239 RepID=Q17835_CAEEL|nr:GH18 domain-containing protein [Caenorhabditis elegans]CAA91148.1 GH18 domain-containing protein [Caenorhabditis elegans]|eukprot:NP_496127.1 CHItinase-Like [Caenorhabditis elegans]
MNPVPSNSTNAPLLENQQITRRISCLIQWKHLIKPCLILIAILVFSAPVAYSLSELIMVARHKSETVSNLIKIFIPSSKKLSTTTKTNSPPKHLIQESHQTISPPAAFCGKRIVGYFAEFENAGLSRKQLHMLTHIIYLFARPTNGVITLDGEQTRRKFEEMKSKAREASSTLKVMISVGGHDYYKEYSRLVSNETSRNVFVKSIVSFFKKNDIDGIEIFWTRPKYEDIKSYSSFIQELRSAFTELQKRWNRKNEYIISLIVPKEKHWSFDLKDFSKFVDFFNIYSTQFREKQVGPDSPLYGGEGRNIDETMKYYICKTGQPSKFNIMVSFHGTFWEGAELPLRDYSDDIWKEKNVARGPFAVRWRHLRQRNWNLTDIKFHNLTKTSYIWIPGPPTWFLTLEDEKSLREKNRYVADHNIGGITMWTIDQDDDDHTLLKVVSSAELCTGDEKNTIKYTCE